MKKDTIIPVKFDRKLTFEEINAFSDMCLDFGSENKVDVTHISLSAVARRVSSQKSEHENPNDDTSVVNKRYFHELSQEEVDKLITYKKDWGYIMTHYKQPDWCKYPNALEGNMGCWSLVDLSKEGLRTIISKEYCRGCESCSL